MTDELRPTEATIHWLPEQWGYSEAHYSQYLPAAGGHDCNEKCYLIRGCSTITDEQREDARYAGWQAFQENRRQVPTLMVSAVVDAALEAAARVRTEKE